MDSNIYELKKSLVLSKNQELGESLFSDISPNNVLNDFLTFSRLQSPNNFNFNSVKK